MDTACWSQYEEGQSGVGPLIFVGLVIFVKHWIFSASGSLMEYEGKGTVQKLSEYRIQHSGVDPGPRFLSLKNVLSLHQKMHKNLWLMA